MEVAATGACLLCKIGARSCALPLAYLSETMRPLPVEPLAGMPPFVLGLAIIRALPTPVLDAGRLLGAPCLNPARFVTIKLGARVAALAVDAVHGVRALPLATLGAVPTLLGEVSADLVTAIATLDADLLLVLQMARLVPDAVWSELEAARARA